MRPKGSPNKLSADAKEDVIAVFVGLGGPAKMKEWAEKNLTDFYTKIFAKLIPLNVQGNVTVTPKAIAYPQGLPDEYLIPTASETVDSIQ
jgi:hypothetical protein